MNRQTLRRPTPYRGFIEALPKILVLFALACMILVLLPDRAWQLRPEHFIVIGLIGVWRYSWMLLHIARSFYYEYLHFPRLREEAV